MESITYLKNVRIAPKKLRFFTEYIKKLSPSKAIEQLLYSTEKPSQIFYKSIKSAVSNAKQTLKVGDDLLQFKTLTIEEGQKMKRYRPGGRGTARMIRKRSSHIKIVLTVKADAVVNKKSKEQKVEPVKTIEAAKPKVKRTAAPKKTGK